MQDPAELVRFYEATYSAEGGTGERYARWRELGARAKAAHVIELCRRARLDPAAVLDVGCGDGSVLAALHRAHFGLRLTGVEIAQAAVAIAAARPELAAVELYDGRRLPFADQTYELGILSHVLEHVPAPTALLAEAARVCEAVVFEVPLEANWSASRPSRRRGAAEIGHLHRFDRRGARELALSAGLRIEAELRDPLSLPVHTFFARGRLASLRGSVKWLLRAGLDAAAPPLARRAFTLHYACLCRPPGG